MKIYLISYDLSKPLQEYEGLIKEIKNFDDALHLQNSVWLIDTNFDCNYIYSKLSRYLDINDNLFICPLDLDNVNCYTKDREVMKWFDNHNYIIQTQQ